MEAETFLREILVGQLHVRKIFVGEDFRFGYKRCGDVELLKAGEEKYGYTVTVVDKACFGPDKVSSSTIRRLLRTGSLREANAMLGRPMFYTGPIVAGNQIGRTLGFPTANLPVPEEKALLPSGVYGVTFYTEGERYYGAANIGRKPTVQQRAESAIGIETHLFDCSRDLYGKNVKINFHFFVRPERRFDSLESLKEEIHKNERQIREYFEKNPEF
jgi:riboflavin kinase/FMN adenylyltransferase